MYYIYYKYRNMAWEEIDSADSRDEAKFLLSEYRMAYGLNCRLEIRKK